MSETLQKILMDWKNKCPLTSLHKKTNVKNHLKKTDNIAIRQTGVLIRTQK